MRQEVLDEPQALWSHYIEMEPGCGHLAEVRVLFEVLLQMTNTCACGLIVRSSRRSATSRARRCRVRQG